MLVSPVRSSKKVLFLLREDPPTTNNPRVGCFACGIWGHSIFLPLDQQVQER